MSYSQKTVTKEGNTEDKEEESAEDGQLQTEAEKEVIRAFRTLLRGCEEQWCYATQQDSVSSESEDEESSLSSDTLCVGGAAIVLEEDLEDENPEKGTAALSMR